jgi:hypothetical protein
MHQPFQFESLATVIAASCLRLVPDCFISDFQTVATDSFFEEAYNLSFPEAKNISYIPDVINQTFLVSNIDVIQELDTFDHPSNCTRHF